ncbi:hypothetical protein KA005_85130 [bacterium]|nr:hypothetical protein [bacterium]
MKAVTYCPKESQYWANLGGAYGALGDYLNSVSALKKGLEIAPKSIQLMENLGVTYVSMMLYWVRELLVVGHSRAECHDTNMYLIVFSAQ